MMIVSLVKCFFPTGSSEAEAGQAEESGAQTLLRGASKEHLFPVPRVEGRWHLPKGGPSNTAEVKGLG